MPLTVASVAAAAREAAGRLVGRIEKTPLRRSPGFSAATGADVWLKLENLQLTGSFKLRGATHRLLTLSDAERKRPCVAASSGNHGAGVACAARTFGMQSIVFVPETAAAAKVAAIESYGGEVRVHGSDGLDTELYARAYAEAEGLAWISPYNDPQVIAGQATCGVEIAAELENIDALFVAVGGGGLISGVGSVLREANPGIEIIACQPAASAVMAKSVAAGRLLELDSAPTLSDGTAGGVESDAVTFDLCRELVDHWALVDEAAIASALRHYIDVEHMLIEGAAAVAVAAFLERAERYAGKRVVILICGGNISAETLASILV